MSEKSIVIYENGKMIIQKGNEITERLFTEEEIKKAAGEFILQNPKVFNGPTILRATLVNLLQDDISLKHVKRVEGEKQIQRDDLLYQQHIQWVTSDPNYLESKNNFLLARMSATSCIRKAKEKVTPLHIPTELKNKRLRDHARKQGTHF